MADKPGKAAKPEKVDKPDKPGKYDHLREDIAVAAAKLPGTVGSGRELKKLEGHLWDGETVDMLVTGTYGSSAGLMTLTDRRLLFTRDSMMSAKSEDIPIDKISSVQWSSGIILGKITIFASGTKSEIVNVPKDAGKLLVDHVRSRLGSGAPATEASTPAAPTAAPAATDITEQIRKLSELRDAGILTEKEFSEKKAELLKRL